MKPLTAACLGTLLGVTVCACSGSTPSGNDLITPSQALTVVQQSDAKAVQANGALNTSLQDTFETGPAALADDASYVEYRLNKVTGLPPFTTSDTKVYVPHQSAYPLQFLSSEVATGKTTDGKTFRGTSISLFTKASASAPWKIYYEAYSETPTDLTKVVSPPAFALDSSGYAVALPASQGGLTVSPDKVAATLAGYMNSGSGAVAQGDFTSTYRSNLVNNQTVQSQNCSCHVSWQMASTSYPTYAYQLHDGSALVFYAMLLTVDLTNGHFHSDGTGLGVLGPATTGDFTSLSVSTLEQQAALLPAHGNISVPYSYEQQTMVTGGAQTV